MYTHVHRSIVDNSQKVEATQMSTDDWIDKQNIKYSYNGVLFSLKKNGNPDTCNSVTEPWGHYAKWKKPDTKEQIPYECTQMRYLEGSNSKRQKVEYGCQG